jgi:hypothetical protein
MKNEINRFIKPNVEKCPIATAWVSALSHHPNIGQKDAQGNRIHSDMLGRISYNRTTCRDDYRKRPCRLGQHPVA